MTLLEAIDAALDFVHNHPDEMTRPDVNNFEELGDDVYKLAMAANLVSALPQVPELRPELESQDPPLRPVQFISKLHLPGDWEWPATEGDLDSPPTIGSELPELPRATFLVSASPRWLHDMNVLRSLAMDAPVPTARKIDGQHSDDFRSIVWRGQSFSFTANQALVVRLLWQNYERCTPDVGDEALLNAIDPEAPPRKLTDVFRECAAWNTAIVAGETKGTHRLA
jgi:hypothetical protein